MATGQSICQRALRLLNALGTGESVGSDLQADILGALNTMLDSWNLERLIIYSVERKTFTLIASTNPHTIGSGGQINVARPVKIDTASIIESDVEYPLEIISKERFQQESAKATQTATIPRYLYYDPQYDASGLGRVYLLPIPATANTLALYLWTALSTAITWGGTITFPPGYQRAIEYNLAIEFAPEVNRQPSEAVVKVAVESKAQVKSINMPILYAEIDEAVLQQGSAAYDIYSNR